MNEEIQNLLNKAEEASQNVNSLQDALHAEKLWTMLKFQIGPANFDDLPYFRRALKNVTELVDKFEKMEKKQ